MQNTAVFEHFIRAWATTRASDNRSENLSAKPSGPLTHSYSSRCARKDMQRGGEKPVSEFHLTATQVFFNLNSLSCVNVGSLLVQRVEGPRAMQTEEGAGLRPPKNNFYHSLPRRTKRRHFAVTVKTERDNDAKKKSLQPKNAI